MKTTKLFRAETSLPNRPKAFTDWFHAEDEQVARALWAKECKASGLPSTATAEFMEMDPVTLTPVMAIGGAK